MFIFTSCIVGVRNFVSHNSFPCVVDSEPTIGTSDFDSSKSITAANKGFATAHGTATSCRSGAASQRKFKQCSPDLCADHKNKTANH